MRSAALIFNPEAGRRHAANLRQVRRVRDIFRDAGVATTVVETSLPPGGEDLLRQIEDAVDAVIVCGGDGTINQVVQAYVRSAPRAALGVIPLGSGNLLARELKIPARAADAARAMLTAQPTPVKLACAEWSSPAGMASRYWLAAVGIGVDASAVARLTPWQKARFGAAAYYVAAARAVLLERPVHTFSVQWVDLAGDTHSAQASQVFVERIDYFGACVDPARRCELRDGHLRAVLFKTDKRSPYIRYGLTKVAHLAWGFRRSVPEVEVAAIRELTCSTSADGAPAAPITSQIDGESLAGMIQRIRVSDKTIPLLVPTT